VFRARQREPEREVAVKVLDPALAREPAFAERFAREAEALARLAHPHVVAVYGHGRAGEHFYLVLEFAEGGSARELLARGPLAPKRAVALVTEVARALEFAHAQGIVHRDIKPENLLLDREGHVKVADFGLARFAGVSDARLALTSTGRALGTLRYMAPEQLERPETVDHRADLYALGVVFYELLTGEVPMGRFEPPSKRAGVDPRLDEIVLHLLDRDPGSRYRSSQEFLGAVGSFEHGDASVHAVSPSSSRGRRFSWLAVSSAAVSFLCSLASVEVFLFAGVPTYAFQGEENGVITHVRLLTLSDLSGAICLMVPWLVAVVLARAALDRIRASWPALYGVGAAIVGIWFFPLILMNLAGMVCLSTWLVDVEAGEAWPSWSVAVYVLVSIGLDRWWIARKRRRTLERLELLAP
jgi:serine/threonine protein kinase